MDGVKMITERRSIRRYKDEVVPQETLKEIVEVCRYAPSWKNGQIARYNFISDKAIINKIANEGVCGFNLNTKTLQNVNTIAVISYVKGYSGKMTRDAVDFATTKNDTWEMFDTGIACQTFCLAAHEKGLGTCIFGIFDDEYISKLLDLPENEAVGAIVLIGYADETPDAPPRKDIDKIARFY